MRQQIAAIAVVSILSQVGCREAQDVLGPVGPTESPDYAVYDAVLGLFGNSTTTDEPVRLVLADSTTIGTDVVAPEVDRYLRRQFGPELAPVLDAVRSDYIARSSVRVPLDPAAFHLRARVELMSRRRSDSLSGRGPLNPSTYWAAFYARYPGSKGLISFSRPGYDASRTHALLSYGHGCGGLCGDWGFVLLERRSDRWVVVSRVTTGVA